MDATPDSLRRASTGTAGLDYVLGGGWARNRLHLLEGSPGTGKTTLALQFLLAGAESGETGIYVSLAETDTELREGAASHGWTIGPKIEVFELVPPESALDPDQHQSLLYSSDLELGETTQRIFDTIERVKPARVVIDSLSEIRLLAQSSLRYRRPHQREHRPRRAQHRPQRDPSRPAGADLWWRTAAAKGGEVPRSGFPVRLP
jgi:circadian clock protein KaiC